MSVIEPTTAGHIVDRDPFLKTYIHHHLPGEWNIIKILSAGFGITLALGLLGALAAWFY